MTELHRRVATFYSRLVAAFVIAGLLGVTLGCATLRRPDGSINTAVVLSDMRYSVAEACAVEYLPPDACTFFNDALNVADGWVAQNIGNVGVAVRQTLVDWEAKLPPDSKLRPYFDVMIALLPTQ
jgi:hypothetical protein